MTYFSWKNVYNFYIYHSKDNSDFLKNLIQIPLTDYENDSVTNTNQIINNDMKESKNQINELVQLYKDNKLINEISNIYSDTNQYYTTTQSYNINTLIHKYEELKDTVIITFGFLKHEHNHLSRFISNTRKKQTYILIDKDYDNIIPQLYDINIKINEINKELILIKRKQAFFRKYNFFNKE